MRRDLVTIVLPLSLRRARAMQLWTLQRARSEHDRAVAGRYAVLREATEDARAATELWRVLVSQTMGLPQHGSAWFFYSLPSSLTAHPCRG